MKTFLAWLDQHGIPMHKCHTSGHAPLKDLKRLRAAFTSAVVVPVHCAEPDAFTKDFKSSMKRADNEWWEVEYTNHEKGRCT
jgi:ribonuclease J